MKNRKTSNLIRKGTVLLCSLLLVAGTLIIANYLFQNIVMKKYHSTDTVIQEQESIVLEEGTQEAKGVMSQDEMESAIAKHKSISEKETDQTNKNETTIDFLGLKKINQDIYAWISIPGTKIEYPILQHPTDNFYYLNYNIDGSFGYPGCIYTEKENAKDFSDPNTVIYGHNMKNGTMFAGLHQYMDKKFFDENRSIIIYTPMKTYQYQIFAAYVYDDRHLLYSFDFQNKEIFSSYLEDIFNRRDMSSNIDDTISITSDDTIITLVTCISKQPDKRLLIQAVLVN